MNILMTGLTTLIRKHKKQLPRQWPRGLSRVTLAARRREMRAQQLKRNLLMLRQSKLRRHKSFDRVAAFTAALIGTPCELTGVRISMAVAAALMRHLLFEITAVVAFLARNIAVPAAQWKSRHIVVEGTAANSFPAFGSVTLFAITAKTAAMRISVTRRAVGKLEAGVLHKGGNIFFPNFLARRLLRMTFDAGDIFMLACEHELRAFMRKFCRRFPAGKIMAALAGGAELPAMLVGMAGYTFLRQAEQSFFHPHIRIGRKFFLNVFLLMAIAAGDIDMTAF